jgi:flagellar biosynthesis protein FliQ
MDDTASGGLLKRAIAWVIVIAVAVLVLKLAIGAVFGLLQALVSVALLVVVVIGALWALRHL